MTDGPPGIKQGDRTLAVVPQFHAMSWGLPYAAFMIGASLIMPDRFLQPAPLAELIAAERPTFAAAVPTIWQGLHLYLEEHPQDISFMNEVLIGGSAVPPALMHAFDKDHGVQVLHAWGGMTETSPPRLGCPTAGGCRRRRPVALPLHAGQVLGIGTGPARRRRRGTSCRTTATASVSWKCGGPWITGSYYGVDAPEKFDDGWLRTGDVGSITPPDGYLTLTDRTKDIIKSGGEWISSVDLENAVMGHPDVIEAAVIGGVPDDKWDERPLVAVVLREGSTTDVDAAGVLVGQGRQVAAARELDRDQRGPEDERRQVRQEAAAVAVPGR